jgi:putative copper resistance protein D
MRSFGRALVTASALLAGAAVTTWALSVPAYPETYLRSTVPYDAVSITRGLALYGRHCAVCHGVGGRGDGPRASTLSRRPVDLSEPHTALHTAGDIFHWLTYGKAGSPMPGFAGVTTADDRWDLINFLRAFSLGYQARILSPQVVAGRPWLGAPDFEYVDAEGRSGSLKSLRGGSVLLVFYTLPSSRDRLLRLARWHRGAAARDVTIVAVALPGSVGTLEAGLPFVLPVDGAAEAVTSYLLLRRTIADPGRGIIGDPPQHLEFLVDRSGYLRARWRPDGGPGWDDEAALSREVAVLRDEPPTLPPPDDHVH